MKVDFDLLHRFGELPEIVAIGYDREHPNQRENYKLYNDMLDNIALFLDCLTESKQFAIEAHHKLKQLNPDRPFDKLKELWEGYKKTDCSCLEEYLVGKGRAYNSNTIHQWIAEHCGFATTAEVRRAIQKLKNF